MISNPDLHYEKRFWQAGFKFIAGLDEAGRGALAGPVAAAAVILPDEHPHLARTLAGARDSKQMTPLARDRLAPRIKATALGWGVGFASAFEIDSLGIVASTRLAALRALESMRVLPDCLLTDFRLELPELDILQTALVKGDQQSLSIAAASILAKTARDELMRQLDGQYSQYGFARHKGYGTLKHRQMILQIGFSPEHRKTFTIKK
ncbi:MAG: ribonuclease HII [Chloroflexi bacterium]|nr:ribonuclease HII [Chloroflexota bacterium]